MVKPLPFFFVFYEKIWYNAKTWKEIKEGWNVNGNNKAEDSNNWFDLGIGFRDDDVCGM